jgi:predicted dehydrogenase
MPWETTNINTATFIAEVKKKPFKTRFNERQLVVIFDITEAEAQEFTEEYGNSQYFSYDARKRHFTQLVKQRSR